MAKILLLANVCLGMNSQHIKDTAEVNKMSKKICSSQQGSSSSGKRDKGAYNRGSPQGRARKPYFLNYGGRCRSRYRRESLLSSKSSTNKGQQQKANNKGTTKATVTHLNKVCRKLNPVTGFTGNLAKHMVTWRQINPHKR
mgnify:CR=1 FL=1